MMLQRSTVSLCNTCYAEIPAVITVKPDGVWMEKRCSAHGTMTALSERDPVFYTYIMGLKSRTIYGGHFVDVTRKCNLRCEYCYYALETEDPAWLTAEQIAQECEVNRHRAPFILTGGEPTLREDLPEIIERIASDLGPVELLTNGTKLADKAYFDRIMGMMSNDRGEASVNLSIHPETDKWQLVLKYCRTEGIKLESALIVIDSKEAFFKAIGLAKTMADVVMTFRIKAASRIWAEQKPENKIFVSDMIHWLEESGRQVHLLNQPGREHKTVFVNTHVDGLNLMLVAWHDAGNVDLLEIACPPTYRARNGEVANFVAAGLINEGMSKGWLKGQRLSA